MRIDRFAVRDFRKLVGDVEIAGLAPGITVISGENEEGKSTLLKALQAAFFDRHGLTGKAIDEIVPFGTEGSRPWVEVEFELDGTSYRLEKAFARNPAALLEGGAERWQGDTAEDRLRELLDFSRPGRGGASEEHRGLAGLLWVEQGRAFAPLGMNRDSQAVLREAIEGEVGQVLGGDRGRRLLEAVEKRRSDYFTSRGREREALSGPRKRVEELEQNCEQVRTALQEYDQDVNRLVDLQRRIDRYEREGLLVAARAEADRAEEAVRLLMEAETQAETAKAQMEAARDTVEAARSERDRRAEFSADAAKAEEESQRAATALEALEPERSETERALAEAEQRLAEANEVHETAEADWQSARRVRARTGIAAELQELESRLEQAESTEGEIDSLRQTLAANPVNDDKLVGLRDLSSKQTELKAALDAAAAALSFAPEGGMAVSLDGQPVDIGQPVRVTERSIFRLQGFGAVEVMPGGPDIVRLRTELSDIETRLRSELRELGLEDLGAAETSMRERQALDRRLQGLIGELKGVAPDGVDALRERVRDRREALAGVGGGEGELPDVETARTVEAAAEERRAETRRAVDAALRERDAARKQHERARSEWVEAETERRQKADTADQRRTALEQERREVPDAELTERAATAGRVLEERKATHGRLVAECEALDPEQVRLERERAIEARDRLHDTIENDRQAARDLVVELRTLGQRGLAEELERMEGELEIAHEDLARIEADAEAWRLLRDVLREAEREAKETFLEPVRERLRPYLRMLFPETELRLKEDDLEISAIVRNGVEEPFASLSIGAREQIAVLTRLALADLLREKGKPAALILDDPLVNSDDPRFLRMQLALRKAAGTLQIIVLTCHEGRYESLGAKTIRLADCRTGG